MSGHRNFVDEQVEKRKKLYNPTNNNHELVIDVRSRFSETVVRSRQNTRKVKDRQILEVLTGELYDTVEEAATSNSTTDNAIYRHCQRALRGLPSQYRYVLSGEKI